MAQQIKKKYLSSEVISYFDDQIKIADDKAVNEKSRAENQEALIRSELSSADDAKLVEAKAYTDSQDALKLQAAKDYADLQDEAKLTEAKAYADSKAAEVKSEIMGGIPDSTLDTIAEIASALASEQTATGAILAQLSGLESSKASKVELAAGVAEAKSYTDSQIAAIPAVDISGKADKSYVDSQDAALQSDLDNLDGYAQDIRSDLDNLDGYAQDIRSDLDAEVIALDLRLDVLEAKVDGPFFHKMKVQITTNLSYVDLAHEAISNSVVASVGRLMVHKDEDFSMSVVGGVTRLTWIGSMVSPNGEEAIEAGDNVFVTYAY